MAAFPASSIAASRLAPCWGWRSRCWRTSWPWPRRDRRFPSCCDVAVGAANPRYPPHLNRGLFRKGAHDGHDAFHDRPGGRRRLLHPPRPSLCGWPTTPRRSGFLGNHHAYSLQALRLGRVWPRITCTLTLAFRPPARPDAALARMAHMTVTVEVGLLGRLRCDLRGAGPDTCRGNGCVPRS